MLFRSIHKAQVQYDLPEGRGRRAMEEYMDVMNQAKKEELAKLIGVGINAMMNDYQKNISLDYRDPYWNLDGVSLGGKVFYNEFEAKEANIVDYTNESYGASLTWGFPFDELNRFEFGVGYTHNKIGNLSPYLQVERKHSPIRVEILNYTKSKHPYWVELELSPVFDEDGGEPSQLTLDITATLILARSSAVIRLLIFC